jgi:hypothetical protein
MAKKHQTYKEQREEIRPAPQQQVPPHYPHWPSSQPGPEVKPPPPGQRPLNALRREQVVPINATS